MHWYLSHRADPRALPLADRHYSRKKPGTAQFVKPGRCVVLLTADADALWVSSWPFAEYTKHAWAGAWECSLFRNESSVLSSVLIREAEAVTRFFWGEPPPPPLPLGMVSFVNPTRVRQKPRKDYGTCYQKAGWVLLEEKTKGGKLVLRHDPADMPGAEPPTSDQLTFDFVEMNHGE